MENPVFDEVKNANISVHGMTCQSCVKNITMGMKDRDGIIGIEVSLEKETAFVTYDSSKTTKETIAEQITEMGYDAEVVFEEAIPNESVKVLLLGMKNVESITIATRITNTLLKENGVISCDIYENNTLAAVSYKPLQIQPDRIATMLKNFDIEVKVLTKNSSPSEPPETTILHIEGMTCDSCTNSIKNALIKLSGIEDVNISLKEKKAVVKHFPSGIKREEVRDAIDDIGFDATLLEEGMSFHNNVAEANGGGGLEGQRAPPQGP